MVLDDEPSQRIAEPAAIFKKGECVLTRPRRVLLPIEPTTAGVSPVSRAMQEEVEIEIKNPSHREMVGSRSDAGFDKFSL